MIATRSPEAAMTAAREKRVVDVLAQRQPDLTVLLEHVNKPHNLSAILRTCDAVGILQAHAVSVDGKMPTYTETAASADKWVPLTVFDTSTEAIASLREGGYQLVATHLSARALDYRAVDYTRPTCVILGAERWGVSAEVAEQADVNVIIPMRGMVQSLNVSVAAAVILFEAARQRENAGCYAAPRLSDAEREALGFEWLYPTEAAFLRDHAQPYPPRPELRRRPRREPDADALDGRDQALERLKAKLQAAAASRAEHAAAGSALPGARDQ